MQVATFIHGNRLETLAERLIDDELQRADADPLRGQVVVVAHPALGRWLQERVAYRLGIAANIDFPLPSSFVWDVLRALVVGLPQDSAFSREALAWRIYAALPLLVRRPSFAAVRHYLGDGSDARRRFDLAGQLARSFDEIMVARPAWIRAWSRGRSVVKDEHEAWQAELWRHLAEGVEEDDRATLMGRAIERLRDPAQLPDAVPGHLAVFGAAFLPPLLLEFFVALATRVPLRFYQPNPCLDYWGDIVSERERARRLGLWASHKRRDDLAYAEAGHPLLASWGVLGREYLKAIHAPDTVVHDDDAFVMPDASHLLGWLQAGILLLDPQHAPPPRDAVPSIELHGCPDRRREIEVLRDRLLARFEREPDLKPHDILVMAPQIDAYVPVIDAVFGGADGALALPYRISDVPLHRAHPLVDAFLRVLALGDSRFTRADVCGLLAEPAIARRFGIDAEGQAWIATWLEESGVRWGLDAPFRATVGAAAIDENTWRFGLDRLLLGHALGDESSLVGDVAPLANVEGAAAQALGGLACFVDALAATRAGFAAVRTVNAWKGWIGARLDALFDVESSDPAERVAIHALRDAISRVANTAQSWLDGERLPFDVVRSALEASIGEPEATRAGRFGITFCGMVPMRNVPHRVVCVLGLDAGRFPRREPVAGFNLVRRHPLPGDRSVREDDRFLFLEALVAARDALHLSYVDRDPKSGGASSPSPLVEELLDFLRGAYGPAWVEVAANLRFQHRMHPFAPDYFDAEAPLRSYDAAWWAAAKALVEPWREPSAFAANATPVDALAGDAEAIERDDLMRWLRDPVATWFRGVLPIRVQAESASDDGEPFTLDGLARFGIGERLLDAAQCTDLHRLQREGVFPLGPAGDQQWKALARRIEAIEAATVAWLGDDVRRLESPRRVIDVAGTALRLAGTPNLLVEGRVRALLLRRAGGLRGSDFAQLALERALLGDAAIGLPARAIGIDKDGVQSIELAPLADEAQWLAALLTAFAEGRCWPVPLYPRAASAYAYTSLHGRSRLPVDAALAEWNGADLFAGEKDRPLNALFTRDGDVPVLGDAFAALAMQVYAPLHAAAKKVTS